MSLPDQSQTVGAAEQQSNALDVQHLTKVYDDGTVAVDDVSFQVEQGEFCVLIGPSGCGKSTTLHSIVGKVEPTDGHVVMGGRDVTDVPTEQRDIGLVFQDFQLFPHLTVAENVRYGLERMDTPESEIEERVGEMLELLGLSAVRERPPGELSAGQQQRVALARSLVLEPDLLLLDEPLGDLDYKLQKSMEREFLRIHRELETTFVYVTHDQTQAMRLGDHIVVMNDGKIEQAGSVDEIYDTPDTAFVATFVGDTNVFYGTVTDVDGETATVETDDGALLASTRTVDGQPADLLESDVVVAVRPQHLRLTDGAQNTRTCTVDDVIYRPGRGTQLLLTDDDRSETDSSLQLTSAERIDPDTETVTVGWDPTDAIVLDTISVVDGVDLETDILGE